MALRLEIQNWRWADVPFYLRTGKRLPRRATEIAGQLKQPPLMRCRQSRTEPERTLRPLGRAVARCVSGALACVRA